MKGLKLIAAAIGVVAVVAACGKDKYQPKGDYAENKSTSVYLTGSYYTFNDGHGYEITASAIWYEITQDVLDNGIVMAYFQRDGAWVSIPWSTHDVGMNETIYFEAYKGYLNIIVDGYRSSGSPSETYLNGMTVKIAVISKAQLADNPDVDLNSYEAVKEAFDL